MSSLSLDSQARNLAARASRDGQMHGLLANNLLTLPIQARGKAAVAVTFERSNKVDAIKKAGRSPLLFNNARLLLDGALEAQAVA